MCRNIRPLYNFDPPATEDEIKSASLQFVRKVSGMQQPSQVNKQPFDTAVEAISDVIATMFGALQTAAPSRDREVEAAKAKARSLQRFNR